MRFLLRTYGCRANQYDSEAVRSMLVSAGAEAAEGTGDADVAVFNSCSVTAAAEAELRKDVRRLARANPGMRTIVMGCAPGLIGRDELSNPLRTLPTVTDTLVGADLESIASALGLPSQLARAPRGIQTGARALLRIQDGCDEHCTFCMTTVARGANRSRQTGELVREAAVLAETHPEIVLTGIHIGSYGLDIGTCLSALVSRLMEAVPSVRFRLSSLEATEVDDRLRELFGDHRRLAPYLHAPLQSASDRVLKRMGRSWYTARTYESSVEKIVSRAGFFGLGADVICGFPGETEDDHRETLAMVERLPFTSLHVFPYSARPGTASLRLGPAVGSEEIRRRCEEVRDISQRKANEYNVLRSGTQSDVVVTKSGGGLTEDYLAVSVSDPAIRRRARFDATLTLRSGQLTASPTPTPPA